MNLLNHFNLHLPACLYMDVLLLSCCYCVCVCVHDTDKSTRGHRKTGCTVRPSGHRFGLTHDWAVAMWCLRCGD